MNISNIRHESVNTLTLKIDDTNFRIHGEKEITKREEPSIREAVASAGNMEEVAENLSFYNRTITATA